MNHDRQEWLRARELEVKINIPLQEYSNLLAFIGSKFAITYEKDLPREIVIDQPIDESGIEYECLVLGVKDVTPLEFNTNDLERFDQILSAEDLIKDLERELGLI